MNKQPTMNSTKLKQLYNVKFVFVFVLKPPASPEVAWWGLTYRPAPCLMQIWDYDYWQKNRQDDFFPLDYKNIKLVSS